MQNLLAAFFAHASSTPQAPALLFVKRGTYQQFTYEDLALETERWARSYRGSHLQRDALIAIVLDHRAEMYAAFLGAMRAGCIPTFLPYPTPKQEPTAYWRSQAELFERIRPACVVTYGDLHEPIEKITATFPCTILDVDSVRQERDGALPPLDEIDHGARIALLQHSSGTTGAKKGVALTFAMIREQTRSHAERLGMTAHDRVVSWLPLYHDMGLLSAFLFPFAMGSSVVSFDAFEWLMRPAMMFELIERYRATNAYLPNFALNHLIRTHDASERYDLSSLEAIVSTSEPCRAATFDAFEATFAPLGLGRNVLRAGYGMAECVYACTLTATGVPPARVAVNATLLAAGVVDTNPATADALYLSCGKPLDGMEIRIAASDGRDVGEIHIRGRFLFDHYYRSPIPVEHYFDDGWYRTGDVGFVRDGEIFVCGRIKEMLVVHGQNFYATDIEAIVDGVPGVKPGRTVAFGIFDDATASEEAVVLSESPAESAEERAAIEREIRSAVYGALGLQVRTVGIRPLGELVKTTSGKMARGENARRYQETLS